MTGAATPRARRAPRRHMDHPLRERRTNPIFADTADIPETPEPVDLQIRGTVPAELNGILYRNGPVRFDGGGFAAQHPFDGDGLVCRYRLDDGRVRFRSRYVRTRKFTQIQNGRGADVKGIGNRLPGWWRNLRLPADSANTHAMFHAGRLLALSDVGKPWELDPHTLATIGVCSLDGSLSRFGRYSPHPRVDASTGELFNFGVDVVPGLLPKLPLGLRCYRTGADAHTRAIATIPLDGAHIQHDFAITEKFLVLLISPITVDPWKALTESQELAAQWHPDRPTRVVLVPRTGGQMIEYTLDEPLAYVHVVNAYQDDLGVHVDLVRFADPDDFFVPTRQFRTSTRGIGGCTTRVTIAGSGAISLRDINAHRYELPQYDWRRAGLPYTYRYYATLRS